MGWLQRMFGMEKPADPEQAISGQPADAGQQEIPAERVGLNGEYDDSGLAKRVALAFDQDAELGDIETVWVAQTGGTVVLKGQAPSQDVLNKMVEIANGVNGATAVDSNQVEVA